MSIGSPSQTFVNWLEVPSLREHSNSKKILESMTHKGLMYSKIKLCKTWLFSEKCKNTEIDKLTHIAHMLEEVEQIN